MTNKHNNRFKLGVPVSSMYGMPDNHTQRTNEVLFGEYLHQTDISNNTHTEWIHVEAARDGYAGYILTNHLVRADDNSMPVTHKVSARSTLIFSEPAIKSRIIQRLPFGARVSVLGIDDLPFYPVDSGGYIWAEHLHDVTKPLNCDPVSLAKTHFLGAPYLWGGCTPMGVDCSGLVQALANAQGLTIPRDSGDQEQALTMDINTRKRSTGDIVYWPGHTGILATPDVLLHATAHSLSCVIEPLNNVIDRAGSISSIKRLFAKMQASESAHKPDS